MKPFESLGSRLVGVIPGHTETSGNLPGAYGGVPNDLTLDDPRVSRRHALLRRVGSAFRIEDLGSTNGTYVNGIRLEGRQELVEHDRVRIGATLLCFNLRDDLELDAEPSKRVNKEVVILLRSLLLFRRAEHHVLRLDLGHRRQH